MTQKKSITKILGPGLLYAGAAIGVSHLVQSTKAGAGFGFELVWAVVIANVLKFPFFDFGPRYAASTGKSILHGFAAMGKWAVGLFMLLTLGTMFFIQAAVTVVTAGLAMHITGIELAPWLWSLILLSICMIILLIGRYKVLDNLMKFIIITLSVTTIVALIAGFSAEVVKSDAAMQHFSFDDTAAVLFLIALMGWMPAPIDISVWHSVWTVAKNDTVTEKLTLKESLLDFRIGYWGTAILALCFLSLGATMIYGTGTELAQSGGGFAKQLIGIYTESIGSWAYPIIAIAAFTTMFSTTLTCLDAFPRVLTPTTQLLFFNDSVSNEELPIVDAATHRDIPKNFYWIWIGITVGGAILILALFLKNMGTFVNIATSISFITAPILAILSYLAITGKTMPKENQPSLFLKTLAWVGMIFLTGFGMYYATTLFH